MKHKIFKEKGIIIFGITLVILLAEMFYINKSALAYGRWNSTTNMPEKVFSDDTGLFPQILKDVTYTGEADTQFPYEAWATSMSSGTVYCADQGAAVRYGKIDYNKYYIDYLGYPFNLPNNTYDGGDGNGGFVFKMKQSLKAKIADLADSKTRVRPGDSISISYTQTSGPNGPDYSIDISKSMLVYEAYGNNLENLVSGAVNFSQRIMRGIFSKLSAWDQPTKGQTKDPTTDPKEDNDVTKGWNETNGILGPTVAVMETEAGKEDHYQISETSSSSNTDLAFILTTMENAYKGVTGSIRNRYSLSDVQTAYWIGFDADKKIPHEDKLTDNGKELYKKAKNYVEFVNNYLAEGKSYKAQVYGVPTNSYASGAKTGKQDADKKENSSSVASASGEAQVIVDQTTKSYIVGPLKIEYPYYEDISYLKSIYLKTSGGTDGEKTLVYDENKSDFEIQILDGYLQGSNGLTKKYPASNSKFYIKFSAEQTGYPTKVNIYADLEYLAKTNIKYSYYETGVNVYQYIGYAEYGNNKVGNGEYDLRVAYGNGTQDYYYKKWVDCYHDPEGGTPVYGPDNEFLGYAGGKIPHPDGEWEKEEHRGWVSLDMSDTVYIFQPFVQMKKTKDTLVAQKLTAALDGSREYEVYTATLSGKKRNDTPPGEDTPPDEGIDLTFELGGRVWVDERAGKENAYDGLYNKATDKPMSNVKVTLYQVSGLDGNQKGKEIATTKTDANGEYLFQEQNAMYQYYVEFTYNGQYYQPTVYNVNRSDSNWNNTSKGLDVLSERDAFNARFEEVGSSPNNLAPGGLTGEVHTREELEKSGAIDEFGNPKGGDSYVTASMMKSYTCNGTTKKDLYPGYQIFVTEDFLNESASQLKLVAAEKIKTLYNNPDVMHHINQGYVLREQVDLALMKDVYKATLEINGKTQTYNYRKRDGLTEDVNGKSYWDIKTRLSDAYYTDYYTRPLFREDYDYQVDNYKIVDDTTTLDNLQLKGYDHANPEDTTELKIYVTYKYVIRNRSEGIDTKVTEIVDYYDKDYTYIPNRSYVGDSSGNVINELTFSEFSRYGQEKNLDDYKTVYLTNAVGTDFALSKPDSNKDTYLYVTFLVNKDANGKVILDEDFDGSGKENIAEINGYKTYYGNKAEAPNKDNSQTQQEYKTGDIAGIMDCNSTPGNLTSSDPKTFENDTDKAPNIRILLNKENVRTVEGNVWEDVRDVIEPKEKLANVGNGLRETGETRINGVRVQLVELRQGKDGKTYEYIWKEVLSGNTDPITPIINNSNLLEEYSISKDDANGKYKFEAFVPGDYIVRFIYGSGESSVLGTAYTNYNTGEEGATNEVTNLYAKQEGYKKKADENASGYSASSENIGLNKNSYNGQDYKSTSYQVGVNNGSGAYTNNTTDSYKYNFSSADQGQYSDAKDMMNVSGDNVVNIAPEKAYLVDCNNARKNVNSYSRGETQENANSEVKNHLAEILASYENLPEYRDEKYNVSKYSYDTMKNMINEFMKNTYMVAESGRIDVNFEYNRTESETEINNSNIGTRNYDLSGYYILENLDLGLEQRPKAQLKVTKQITNVKLTLANNSVLFDASARATNILWMNHSAHGQDTENTYLKDKNYVEGNNLMLTPEVRQHATNKGKVQLTMDEELMHGSTLQITYAITVANVGEVDYDDNQFYYTGMVGNAHTIVRTDPKMLVDYVGTQVNEYNSVDDNTATRNNLQFNKAQNGDWEVISSADLVSKGLVNRALTENIKKYTENHIITTTAVSRSDKNGLVPIIADQANAKKIADAFKNDPMHALETVNKSESVSGVQLILTQMITQDSSSDDRVYNNMTELVTTQNTVGRRMAYSVVGNQDPTSEPREIDADDAQEVVILPPFGNTHIYYVLISAVALILIVGITIVICTIRGRSKKSTLI